MPERTHDERVERWREFWAFIEALRAVKRDDRLTYGESTAGRWQDGRYPDA